MRPNLSALWIARALIFLNALIWLGVGIATIIQNPLTRDAPAWVPVLSAAFVAYGLVLAASGWLLGRWRMGYILAAGLMILTVILFIFDDFGWVDLVSMLPALAAAVYLLANRRSLSVEATAAGSIRN